ncbi:hypothetical protein G7072_12155 [Nocardioides sp. HDW12B]|uniref:hypothetical protein n=1 Tax=Nocardioides sp. HDW12B TaxID=2714939 RepID=UPI0014097724|nr:hypothetical protein [Nocardioides sp. HDW12B]QIK66993.1 hypothetical protein G7072_12155 [Nocardioides sp. HDW12B]
MLWLVSMMLVALLLAGAVTAYVAYPRRGRRLPLAPALGTALERGVQHLPTLDNARR